MKVTLPSAITAPAATGDLRAVAVRNGAEDGNAGSLVLEIRTAFDALPSNLPAITRSELMHDSLSGEKRGDGRRIMSAQGSAGEENVGTGAGRCDVGHGRREGIELQRHAADMCAKEKKEEKGQEEDRVRRGRQPRHA